MGERLNMRKTIQKAVCFILFIGITCIFPGITFAFNEVKYVRDISEHLKAPIDSVVAKNGDIFILDKMSSLILVFNENGQLKYNFGERGSLNGQMYNPQSIALNGLDQVIVADTGNARINVYSKEGHFRYQLGNEGQNKGEYEMPVAVSVDSEGYIYAADGHLNKIARYSPKGVFLEEINLQYQPTDIAFGRDNALYVLSSELGSVRRYQDGILTKEMIFERDGKNLLSDATGISMDGDNDVYLITREDNSIYKFTQNEEFIFSFGSKGKGRGQFVKPSGIVYSSGKVYVSDTNNQRLQIFEVEEDGSNPFEFSQYNLVDPTIEYKDSYYVSKFISDLTVISDQEFYALSDSKGCIFKNAIDRKVLGLNMDSLSDLLMPKAFALKHSGEILVADTKQNRVQFLNADGSYGYKFGIKGKNQSQFNNLEGIAIHSDGHIYVADTDNHRIQIFNSDGIYLKTFGEKSGITEDGNPAPGTFVEPKAVEFDSKDNLFVLDYRNKRIQIFDDEGHFLSQITSRSLANEFKDPVDIAIDENDYLYVADRGDHSIKIFDPEHKFVYKFGSEGRGPSYFPSLSAVDSLNNKIYVADYNVESVQVFEFNPYMRELQDQEVSSLLSESIAPSDPLPTQKSEPEENDVSPQVIHRLDSPDKVFLSRITYALGYINLPYETKVLMLQKDLAQNNLFSAKSLNRLVIESEDEIDSERVRIVISLPKE